MRDQNSRALAPVGLNKIVAVDAMGGKPSRQIALALQARQRGLDLRILRRLRFVSTQRGHVCGLTHQVNDGVATARLLDVGSERPLAHTPVSNGTIALLAHARHVVFAPIGLTCNSAKIRLHLNANVVRALVIIPVIHALAIASKPRQRHALRGASLQGTTQHVGLLCALQLFAADDTCSLHKADPGSHVGIRRVRGAPDGYTSINPNSRQQSDHRDPGAQQQRLAEFRHLSK